MDLESNGADSDDNFLIEDEHSTNYNSISNKNLSEQQKKVFTLQADTSYNFSDYIDTYERIYTFFSRGDNRPWQTLFIQTMQQTSTPYILLYMFLDYTLNTTNGRKHKMVVPFIETFKQMKVDDKDMQLDDGIKENILSKVCRRCALNQLESIIEIFHLRSMENRQFIINFISIQLEQHQDIIFISQLTKFLQLLELNAISFEKIILPLILKTQWETIKFVIGDDRNLQQKLLKTIDDLISTDQAIIRSLFAQASIQMNINSIDTHSLKRVARKLLKQYKFDLRDFPNLAIQEKVSFLKTCFVKKYIENKGVTVDDEDEKAWKEQIKDLVQDNRDLKVKLIDLFVDYIDVDSAVEWTQYYNLEDFEIPEQVKIRREEIRHGDTKPRYVPVKPATWPVNQSENDVYKQTVLPSDIVYIELESNVDSFLNRLECSRCDVGSHLPFVGFDCETFIDPTQRTLSSQIVSIIQLASLVPSRNQSLYGVFDMLALRLQFDMKSVAEFAQRVFCSQDFILFSYNYAGDTSSLLENYPSMNSALMQGSAVIDLSRVQQYILEHYPDVFPYGQVVTSSKSRGLSELVRLCFGKPLDKTQQTSDWRKRPLKPVQLIYSVLDARVLVDIAVFIEERARSLQIPWSWSDFKGYTWTDKAFKKRTGAHQQSVNTS